MYYARVVNEDKCGRMFINRRTSLQIAQEPQNKKGRGLGNLIYKETKRQPFRRKSYTECWKGQQKSLYTQRIDAIIPQSYIQQHLKIERERSASLFKNSKGGLNALSMMKSVRFSAKLSRQKSPLKLSCHAVESPKQRNDNKHQSQVSSPTQRSQLSIQLPEDRTSSQRQIQLPQRGSRQSTLIINDTGKNKMQQRNNQRSISQKRKESENLVISIGSYRENNQDEFSPLSYSQTASMHKNSEMFIPTLSLINQTSIRVKESIDISEPRSPSITNFQDEIIENKKKDIRLRLESSNIEDSNIDDQQNNQENHNQSLKEQFKRNKNLMLNIKQNQYQILENQYNSQIDNKLKENNIIPINVQNTQQNQSVNQNSLKQISKLDLDKIPKYNLKRSYQTKSIRESPSSRSVQSNQWNTSTISQQKSVSNSNYWRFFESIQNNSNKILQDIQADRKEQSQLLSFHQVSNAHNSFKKFYKNYEINFENIDPSRKPSSKQSLDRCQTARINQNNSRQASPLQSATGNQKFIFTQEQAKFPLNQDNIRSPNSSGQHLLNKGHNPRKPQTQALNQMNYNSGGIINEKYKVFLSTKNNNKRSSSTNHNNPFEKVKKQSVSPSGQKNTSDQFKKNQSQSILNIKNQRMVSPLNSSKFSHNNKFYFDNQSNNFKILQKSQQTSPLKKQIK